MKKFIKKLVALALFVTIIFGLINYAYIRNTRNFGTMSDCKNDDAYIKDVPENIEICNVGNSHGYYGFNYEDYLEEYKCFNFSLSSQSMSYNYRILNNYRENISPGALVLICLSYNTFFGVPEEELSHFESMNKRYYQFLKTDNIKEFDLKTYMYVKYFPSLETNTVNLIETLLNKNEIIDMWNETTSQENAKEHGLMRYQTHVASKVENGVRIVNEAEIAAVYDIVELCNEIEAVPVLVLPPYLSEYTGAIRENDPEFYDEFYRIIDDVTENTQISFYDYSNDPRFASNYLYFFNTDHMNRAGAKEFVNVLMQEVVPLEKSY